MKKVEEYITEYIENGILKSDSIYTTSWKEANKIAAERNKGEKVLGIVKESYEFEVKPKINFKRRFKDSLEENLSTPEKAREYVEALHLLIAILYFCILVSVLN